MSREVSLFVDDAPVALDYFVQGYFDHTLGGMLAALEGTGEIKTLHIAMEGDNVTINLNNAPVPTNAFVNKIMKNTIVGMVSSLKGVGQINRVGIDLSR